MAEIKLNRDMHFNVKSLKNQHTKFVFKTHASGCGEYLLVILV